MTTHDTTHTHKPASFHLSPADAMKAPQEDFLYVVCTRAGTGVDAPDFLAVVDTNPESESYGRIVHETPMPYVGDELHHFGWNRCSGACHGPDRSHLIIPGFRSSRVYVVDVAADPRRPRVERVIEPGELLTATGYTRPHTTHCMPGENVVISMLGDADGNAAGGFAVIDGQTFEVKGRWENGGRRPEMNYDFWYQPRKNVLVSSEFGVPNAYEPGFDLDDVAAGRYGRRLHFWNLERRELEQSIDLGETGLVPLEVRWKHDPEADEGYVGAALSSTMWRFARDNGGYRAEQVIAVDPVDLDGWPIPVPGLITDLVLSLDDQALYFSNWLHGDLRRYDVSDPANPRLTGRVWLGGVLGQQNDAGRPLTGGPQMLQLSYDGRRLYVTNSLLSTWDNQFYPGLRSYLLKVDVGEDGSMAVDPDFFVDFDDRADGPARAHEVRLQGGDSTSEVFA
jgi:selenium-binding protein 1